MDTETKTYKLSELYPEVAAKAAQRLHIKKEEIPLVRKYFVADKDSVQVDAQERSIVSRISCSNTDRDGESLLPSGVLLENYKRNPIVCWSHSYNSPEQIVGKNIWIKSDDKGLIAKTAFANNEFADQVYRAYTEDVGGTGPLLRGWSVGFIPIEYEIPTKQAKDGPKRIFTKWELLEYSAVAIPCSPESLTLAYEKGIITNASLKKDLEIDDPIAKGEQDPPLEPEIKSEESETKMLDLDKNPSMWDVFDAACRALNPPAMQEKPGFIESMKCLDNLYPVDYPSGNLVYSFVQDGVNACYMVDYTYEKGIVTLGENPAPVAPGYVRRSGKGFNAGSLYVTLDADISMFEKKIDALQAKLNTASESYKALEIKETPPPAPAITPEDADVLEIDEPEQIVIDDNILDLEQSKPKPAPKAQDMTPEQVQAAVIETVGRLDLKGIIDKGIKLELDKLRGKVR